MNQLTNKTSHLIRLLLGSDHVQTKTAQEKVLDSSPEASNCLFFFFLKGVYKQPIQKKHQTLANTNFLVSARIFLVGKKNGYTLLIVLLIKKFPFIKEGRRGENDLKDLFSLLTAECVEWEQFPGSPTSADGKVSGVCLGLILIGFLSPQHGSGHKECVESLPLI